MPLGSALKDTRIHVDIWQNQYNIVKLKSKKQQQQQKRYTDAVILLLKWKK